jgi:hypothetical protein
VSAFSNYMEAKIVNWMFRGTAAGTAPTNVYVSLHTADPTDAGTGTEVVGNAYARAAVSTAGGWVDPGATSGATENVAEIAFPAATGGNWGTVSHFAIWDAASAGNMLVYGSLTSSKVVNDGDTFRFAAGALDVTVA